MPTYRMIASDSFNDGTVSFRIEVEAPNPEVAEYLVKKKLARMFRNFPNGALIGVSQIQAVQQQIQNEFMGALGGQGGFSSQGDSVIDPVAASQLLGEWPAEPQNGNHLHVTNDAYIEFRNTPNGIQRPHLVGYVDLRPGEQVTISGCTTVPNGTYTILSRRGEIRQY